MLPPVSVESLSLAALMNLAKRGFDALTRSAKAYDNTKQAEKCLREANRLLLAEHPNFPAVQASLAEAEATLPTPSAELLRLKEVLKSAMAFAGLIILVPLAPIAAVAAAAERSEAQTRPRKAAKKSAKKVSPKAVKKHGYKTMTKKSAPLHGGSERYAKKSLSRKSVKHSAKRTIKHSKRPSR